MRDDCPQGRVGVACKLRRGAEGPLFVPLRAASSLLALLLLWLCPGAVHAGDSAFSLHIAPECGSNEAFAGRVAALLGQPTDGLAWPPGQLSLGPHDAGGYRLALSLAGQLRELDDAACASLFAAAVVMVAASFEQARAVDVEPLAHTEHAALLSAPARTGNSAAHELSKPAVRSVTALAHGPWRSRRSDAAARASKDDQAVAETPPVRARASLAAGGGVVLGLLPGAHAQLELAGLAALGPLDLGLTVRYLAPRDLSVPEGSVTLQGVGATVALSYRVTSWLAAGAGLDVHALQGRAHGFAGARRDFAYTAGARAEAWGTVLRAGGLVLAVGVAGLYQPRPATFVSRQGHRLLAANPWGFQAGVRGAWDFF